jgi:hypothetical protein
MTDPSDPSDPTDDDEDGLDDDEDDLADDEDDAEADAGAEDDFGPPFTPKTFGGAFVWAKAPGYTATVLRVREGGNVIVSTSGRRDMVVMLTGGRAVLEVVAADDVDHVELLPAVPVTVSADKQYRLIAQTEVEIFTVYSPGR